MDSRSKGLLATIAAVILCGCPGLFLCITGAVLATGAPINTEFNGVSQTIQVPIWAAVSALCLAAILILIPAVVAFFSLRSKPAQPAPVTPIEPLPPAS